MAPREDPALVRTTIPYILVRSSPPVPPPTAGPERTPVIQQRHQRPPLDHPSVYLPQQPPPPTPTTDTRHHQPVRNDGPPTTPQSPTSPDN